jgi:hypothetical protein
LHHTASNANGSIAHKTINNMTTAIKRQSSIITIPELETPWLATGAPGRGGALAGWAG